MAEAISISSNAQAIVRKFARLPKGMQMGIVTHLKRELLVTETKVRTNTKIKSRRGGAGIMGRLTSYARSEASGMGLDAAIGFRKTRGFPYELSQEFGAKAKPGKAMAVPVSPEAKRSAGPRTMNDLFLLKTRSRALLVRSKGKGLVEPHWVLMKSIQPRLRFRENVIARVEAIGSAIEAGAREGARRA